MTGPIPVAPDPDQAFLDGAVAAAVTAGLIARLEQAMAQLTGLYIQYAGNLTDPIPQGSSRGFIAAASRLLIGLPTDIRAAMWEWVWRALQAGQRNALIYLGAGAERLLRSYGQAAYEQALTGMQASVEGFGQPAAASAQWAYSLVVNAQARLDQALALARTPLVQVGPGGLTYADALAMLAPLQGAVQDLQRDARWAVNAAYNQAVRDSADISNVGRMWIAEEDACLHCLALSGTIAPARQPFDARRTFYIDPRGAYKPLSVWPPGQLWGPPRHPNCRCSVIPVPVLEGYPVMPWEDGEYHPSQALQREARRSVLRGDSGFDSLPAKLRATEALIVAGPALPKSVVDRARRAVRRGRFETEARRWDRVR